MAVNYLAIPTKTTSEVDLVKPLRNFIKQTFPDTKSEDYEKALSEFHRLRAQATGKFNDKHESAIEAVGKYYDQLVAVETKLPFTEDQVRVNFTWYDAFAKGSLLSGKPKLNIAQGSFEKACLLYNIAAIQSNVASVQSKETDEGLKLSAKLFQQSSGILKYLKDNVMSMVGQNPTPDLHPDTLGALSALMVAQAQESIYQKGSIDKMKDGIVSKIAMQCSCYYAEALKLMQIYSVQTIWPKEWVVTVAGKQAAFHALAEYYESGVCNTKLAYGQEIARLQHAKELTQSAMTRGGREVDFSKQLAKIDSALTKVKKDNDMIYHDKIPSHADLPQLGKAVVAKPMPLAAKMSSSTTDLFSKLVPLAIHGAMAAYEAKKSQLVNGEIGRLRESTQTMNGILASLNLPAAIEDVSGTDLPASVKEKVQKILSMGGLTALNTLISELPELLTRNKEILDESNNLLDEEAASDMHLKEQFGDKWTRTPSAKLTEGIRQEGDKYRSIINNAVQADAVVKEKYSTHKTGFELLSMDLSSLQAALPSSSAAASLKDSGAVKQLRSLMQQVEAIKNEREATEAELKNATSDMMAKFVSALAADGALDEDSLSGAELQTIYGPLTQQITDSLTKQEQVMGQVQAAHQTFSQEKLCDQSGAKREEMLRQLAAGYDAYIELKSNLEEGTKFYNDLTQILVKYQNKISDLCFARKTEKTDLMKDLNQQIAARPSESAPSAPNYQKPKATPPSRPPPPTANQAPAPQAAAPPPQQQPARSAPPPPPQGTAPPPQGTAPPPQGPPSAAQYPPQHPPGGLPYHPQPYGYYPPAPIPQGYNPYGYGTGYYQNPPAPYPQQGQPPYPQQHGQPQYGQPGQYPPPQGYQYPAQGYPGYPPQQQ